MMEQHTKNTSIPSSVKTMPPSSDEMILNQHMTPQEEEPQSHPHDHGGGPPPREEADDVLLFNQAGVQELEQGYPKSAVRAFGQMLFHINSGFLRAAEEEDEQQQEEQEESEDEEEEDNDEQDEGSISRFAEDQNVCGSLSTSPSSFFSFLGNDDHDHEESRRTSTKNSSRSSGGGGGGAGGPPPRPAAARLGAGSREPGAPALGPGTQAAAPRLSSVPIVIQHLQEEEEEQEQIMMMEDDEDAEKKSDTTAETTPFTFFNRAMVFLLVHDSTDSPAEQQEDYQGTTNTTATSSWPASSSSGAGGTDRQEQQLLLTAVVALYNLAFSFHLEGIAHGSSSSAFFHKALRLYEIALDIISDHNSGDWTASYQRLVLAVINNIGHIHCHFANFGETKKALHRLSEALSRAAMSDNLDLEMDELEIFLLNTTIYKESTICGLFVSAPAA